uniref:Uncharacterized protein n=1 Tax=viral metagenome TaxID=1070528 RepID=A0A6C0D1Y6_9ZZZZ
MSIMFCITTKLKLIIHCIILQHKHIQNIISFLNNNNSSEFQLLLLLSLFTFFFIS